MDINDIFIGDKNAILLATRISGYGADYQVEVTDPFTMERQEVTIDLSNVQIKEVDDTVLARNNRYEFTLPTNGRKIVFKLLTHGDEIEISRELQSLEKISKGKGGTTPDVTTRLRYMIVSVDGKEDRGFVNRFIQNEFLARDTKSFRSYVKEISPDLDLTFEFESELTGEKEVMNIPFGINFFYPSN